ncbi:hypothetical protein FHR81_002590 [Actinoalloteichus hoggarensis]|nr:hypothetical protein [Actinoalloteichus hoggarensis]
MGDRLLVCSDGLTAVVSDHAIADVLSGVPEPREAVARLIDLANRGGGPDNITCLVADVVSAPVGAPGGAGRGVSAGRGGGSGAGVGGAGRGAAAGVGTGMTGEERAVVGSAVGAAGGVTSPDTGATGGVVGSAGVGGLTRAGVAAQHSDPDRAAVTVPGSTAGGVGGGTGPMAAGVGTGSGLGAACGPPAGWASTTGVAPAWGDVWVSGDARVLGDVRVVEATRPDRPPGMALRCGDVGPATAPSLVFGAAASRPEAAGRLPAPSAGDRRRSGAVGAGSGIGAGPGIRAGTAVTSVPGSEPRVGGPGIGQATRPGPEAGAGSGAGTDPEARNGPVTETGPVTEAGSGSVTGSGSSTDPRTGFGPVLGDGPGRSTAVRVGSRPPQPPDPGATESHTEHSAACENTEVPRRRSLRLPRWFRRLLGD